MKKIFIPFFIAVFIAAFITTYRNLDAKNNSMPTNQSPSDYFLNGSTGGKQDKDVTKKKTRKVKRESVYDNPSIPDEVESPGHVNVTDSVDTQTIGGNREELQQPAGSIFSTGESPFDASSGMTPDTTAPGTRKGNTYKSGNTKGEYMPVIKPGDSTHKSQIYK